MSSSRSQEFLAQLLGKIEKSDGKDVSVTDGQTTVTLTEKQAKNTAEVLKKLLEIKELNEEAVVRDFSPNANYNARKKQKAAKMEVQEAIIERSKANTELLEEKRKVMTNEDGSVDLSKMSDGSRRVIEECEQKLEASEEKLKAAKDKQTNIGPIYDINEYINKLGRR